MIGQDFTVGSTGFVNYFPSSERTARNIREAYEKHGDDIIILDGEDDWYADPIFNVSGILKDIGVCALDDFHIGISGMSKSGKVLKKEDLPKVIEYVKHFAPHYVTHGRSARWRLAYYDRDKEQWCVLVKREWDD
jgi:hypothetical protein